MREMTEELQPAKGPTRQRGIMPIRVTLPAGVPKRFGIAGDYFHVFQSAVSDLEASFDGDAPTPVAEGVGFRRYYNEIELRSATGGAVVVYAGHGSVGDGRATVTGLTLNTQIAPGNTFDNGGDVSVPDSSVELLIAADPDRLYAKIALPSDAIGPIRIGTSAVDANSGDLVEPGMSVPVATTAALYAYQTNGAPVTVVVSAVREV